MASLASNAVWFASSNLSPRGCPSKSRNRAYWRWPRGKLPNKADRTWSREPAGNANHCRSCTSPLASQHAELLTGVAPTPSTLISSALLAIRSRCGRASSNSVCVTVPSRLRSSRTSASASKRSRFMVVSRTELLDCNNRALSPGSWARALTAASNANAVITKPGFMEWPGVRWISLGQRSPWPSTEVLQQGACTRSARASAGDAKTIPKGGSRPPRPRLGRR